VARADLKALLAKITEVPASIVPHPTIKKILAERLSACEKDEPMDWATMESLAFASLAAEGYRVRLSGQDVERGTFSHRHAVLNDQVENKEKYLGLRQVSDKVTITNSLLSEFGVMGFEYGYSVTNPHCLTMWEAQFGDFANTAQVMIDNFIAAGEAKWHQQSGLTLLLPHGMDGQGPEHSSCRLERYLQLCNDDPEDLYGLTPEEQLRRTNLHVVYCSRSSNYFHALRRQLRKSYRKPLVVLNSKRLLRLKKAGGRLADIDQGTEFSWLLESPLNGPAATRLVFCTGQFYYDLEAVLEENPARQQDTALVRLEQLCPFPYAAVEDTLRKYGQAKQIIWAQEEHQNQGAFVYCKARLDWLIKKNSRAGPCQYLGRNPSSSSAGGSLKLHKEEEA
jgi:2-oxoglutarate dehydrogenase E1 component